MSIETIASSPLWQRAMPPGPDVRVKITEEYAKLVGRDAYFWAWPLAGSTTVAGEQNQTPRSLTPARFPRRRSIGWRC